jgi:signal transduction histidine kinase
MHKNTKHIGLISILALVAVLLSYIGDVDWLGAPDLGNGFLAGQAYHELCLLALVGPVVYAAFILRISGAIALSIAESLAILPHALHFSPYPDPIFRLAAFTVISVLLATLIGRELNLRDELEEEHSRLEQFLSQTMAAQERERQYLGRELHDESAQVLVDVLHEIDELLEAKDRATIDTRAKLGQLHDQIETVLEGTRRFIKGLRPPLLEEMGLGTGLKWLAQEFIEEQGIEVNVDVNDMGKRLPDVQELNLFRIAQEALTNARKHSQASKIWLSLSISGDKIVLRIQDNGAGFTVPHRRQLLKESKFGLVGIMERARLAGGKVKIESAPAKGTTVTVDVPIGESK